jgi:hypothetical protein
MLGGGGENERLDGLNLTPTKDKNNSKARGRKQENQGGSRKDCWS